MCYIPGQSVLGELNSPKTCSNVPAQASLCVKKLEERLKIFLMVAGIEECSNSEFGVGPVGPLNTVTPKCTYENNQSQKMMSQKVILTMVG